MRAIRVVLVIVLVIVGGIYRSIEECFRFRESNRIFPSRRPFAGGNPAATRRINKSFDRVQLTKGGENEGRRVGARTTRRRVTDAAEGRWWTR